jgi:maleylpyruvate isomerase
MGQEQSTEQLQKPVLHNFFRSSTSHRVRIALQLKRIPYEYVSYQLRTGEQRRPPYLTFNPQGLVPTLRFADGTTLTQSLAIIEYLDEQWPDPPLLPSDAIGRARVRSLSQMIAIDIHPLNNLRVLNELRSRFGADEDVIADWFRHWVRETFGALESRLSNEPDTQTFCHGNIPSLADVCLAAQVSSNTRFAFDDSRYPTIMRIAAACDEITAFKVSAPAAQPDSH